MDLKKTLLDHKKWLTGQPGGCRADLRSASLRSANLVRAYLRGANLEGANLRDADLRGANLRDADLRYANLQRADLRNANLRNADLRYANLQRADLRNANLRNADLRRADLRNANLRNANLRGADLEGASLPTFQLPDGPLTVYKSCHRRIVTLRIPAEAKRTASLVGNKCRAEYAVVLDVERFESLGPAKSSRDANVTYSPGETVRTLNGFSDNIRIECAPGIHFFRTREEAEESVF